MGVQTLNNTTANNYTFRRKAGKSIIERRPIFSPDGESVVVPVENVVRVYNIGTGDCVRILETQSAGSELIAIDFPENEEYNLYGCAKDGCVTAWTWENGVVLREINLTLPTTTRVVTFDLLGNGECFVTCRGLIKRQKVHLAKYCLKTGNMLIEYTPKCHINYCQLIRVAIGWCNSDRFAAITNGTKYIAVQNLDRPDICMFDVNRNGIRIISVTAHRTENAIATTDALGRVTIYRGNLFDKTSISREILHWHSLPVFTSCFSTQGSYLYSGGMEEVLVKWTLGHLANKAFEKVFIPRLPGMIRNITVNHTHVAITLANNSIVIASTEMRVVATILECGGLSPAARATGSALVYHVPRQALLIGGRAGHLQMFSTVSDKVLYNIDITCYNRLTPRRQNYLLPLETEVTCAAVSSNGSWLITSEYRNDGLMYPEEKLKFWSFKKGAVLNTCVSLSHGGCKVNSIAVDFKAHFCVTAGADQKFRIWRRQPPDQNLKLSWSCVSACYYSSGVAQFLSHNSLNSFKVRDARHVSDEFRPSYMFEGGRNDMLRNVLNAHKNSSFVDVNSVDPGMKKDNDLDMGGVDISKDSSLVAAWFGSKLTLWDTHQSSLRTVLSHPVMGSKGKEVRFGNLDAAHYLACTTADCLAVWSLLSLTVKWLVQINPTSLTADPFSNKMAVITANNDVHVFVPSNSTPILTKKRLLDPSTGVFQYCTFGSASDDEIRLFMMRNNSEIYCLEPEKTEDGSLEVISRRSLPRSNFSALLAEQQLSGVKPAMPVDINVQELTSNSSITEFLMASPHMVPPVSLMCTTFLQQLSGRQDPVEEIIEDQEEMQVDDASSDEEDTPKPNHQLPHVAQFWTPNYEDVKEKKIHKILKGQFLDVKTTASIFGV